MFSRVFRALSIGIVLASPLLASTLASAQPPPDVAPPSEPAPKSPPDEGESVAKEQERPEPPPEPAELEIDDPLLATVARPDKMVGSWQEAVRMLSTRSTELAIATAEVARAEGLTRQALGRALPVITAAGTVTHHLIRTDVQTVDLDSGSLVQRTVPASPTALAQLSLVQPILAPRTWYAIGTAERNEDAARLSIEDQQRLLVAGTANAIVGVVTTERVAEINRVSLRAALERLELTRRLQRLGSANRLDVVRAEQDVALARATLITGDESLRQAREALGLALGTSEPYGVTPSINLDGLETAARSTCAPAEVDERADVRSAMLAVELAEREVTDADLLYAPTADVSSTFTLSSEQLANTRQFAWSIQGVLSIPIWDGGVRYGARHSAEASVERERARLDGVRRDATLEANRARRGIEVAEQSGRVARKARDLAAETERLSRLAFQKGVGTSFDLIDSGRRLRESELDLTLREFRVVEARIAALLASARCKY